MGQEATPAATRTRGNLRVWYVPSGSDPLSVAILESATAKPITYSMTGSGFTPSTTEGTLVDDRLTADQSYELPDTVTESLEVQYVEGSPADTALTKDIEGFVVERRMVANATIATVGQKVRVRPILAGVKRPDPPTGNAGGRFTVTQKLFITGPVVDGVLIA